MDQSLLNQLLEEWVEELPTDGSEPEPAAAIACAFEVTRSQSEVVDGKEVTWDERLLVVRSYSYMKSMLAGLQRRLDKAEAAFVALTPPRQRGKKADFRVRLNYSWQLNRLKRNMMSRGSSVMTTTERQKNARFEPTKASPPEWSARYDTS